MELQMLGLEIMDNKHIEFLALVEKYKTLKEGELSAYLNEFKQHLVEHFTQENELMEKYGFFAAHCHIGEHQRVLEMLDDMISSNNKKEIDTYFTELIYDWFNNHLNTMDYVTANFLINNMA